MRKLRTIGLFFFVVLLIAGVVTSVWAAAPRQDGAQEGEPPDRTAKRAKQVRVNDPEVGAEAVSAAINEGFEAGAMPPSGWTRIQNNVNETWKIVTTGTAHGGSYFADVEYDAALLGQDELLLSPAFTAEVGSVELWSKGSPYWCRDTYDNCDLEVWLVGGAWGGGDDLRLGLADDDWTDTYEWSRSSFSFNAAGNPVRIALRYVGNDGAQVAVDDVVISYFDGSGSIVYVPFVISNNIVCPPGTLTPNDPGYGLQWGMNKINAPRAWFCDFQGSGDVVVAVIDTGVDMDHPEFVQKLVSGWDWANDDGWPDDDHGHGSHVAGIVGAIGNNGIGVAGVAWDTRIMPLKTLSADGSGYTSWSASAVTWAADHGADVINMSLGSVNQLQSYQDAVNYAHSQGVLVVASAGNCGDQWYPYNGCDYQDQPSYPGAYNNVMAVGSTTQLDGQSSFSTQGTYVDIAAPGSDIYSTEKNGGYGTHSGTSQASPHVAGLAALVKAAYPSYTPDQIAAVIQGSAVDLGSAGWDIQFGHGRIDAAAALSLSTTAGSGARDVARPDEMQLEVAPLSRESDVEFAPGVVLVKFRPEVSTLAASRALAALDQEVQVSATIPQIELLKLSVPRGSEWDVIESLQALPQVEYAEPDLVIHVW